LHTKGFGRFQSCGIIRSLTGQLENFQLSRRLLSLAEDISLGSAKVVNELAPPVRGFFVLVGEIVAFGSDVYTNGHADVWPPFSTTHRWLLFQLPLATPVREVTRFPTIVL
jgi:hypothetical protein